MSQPRPESTPQDVITVTCIYCSHTWSESIKELEKRKRVVYRDVQDPPGRRVEYRVVCPHCGRKMMVSPSTPGGREP